MIHAAQGNNRKITDYKIVITVTETDLSNKTQILQWNKINLSNKTQK